MATNPGVQLLWIFPIYAFLGWCLEVIYTSVDTGKFVNRGFLNGAVCPIYGIGAGLFILFLEPIQGNFLLLYLGSFVIGSLLELVGGFLLKKLFHTSWWDYSDQPLNIGGYICLKFSLLWGVAGVVLMRVVHPLITNLVSAVPKTLLIVLMAAFYGLFIVDAVLTVLSILKLNRDLQEIDRLSELIRKSSDKIAEEIGDTSIQTAKRIKELEQELPEKTKEVAERIQQAVESNLEKRQVKLEDFERFNALLNQRDRIRSRLITAFPKLENTRHKGALREMKLRVKTHADKKTLPK